MNTEDYAQVFELEQQQLLAEAGELLCRLVAKNDPLALIEFGNRHRLEPSEAPEMYMPGKDLAKVEEYINKGIQSLEALAAVGDGEAMRQLGYIALGFYGPEYRAIELAENWLLKAFAAGCHFASNDLFALYQDSDESKAKHWYAEAEKHGCRVVFNARYET
ncbi:MAG: hypothetical protein HYU78_12780 [Rhodocyclales bacterium]|nr:hypothetical protein [Rhodocyclales bacterium]